MSHSTGSNRVTRVVLGSACNPLYIDATAFTCIKNFVSLAPGVITTVTEPSIRFEVPVTSVARGAQGGARHYVTTDTWGSFTTTDVVSSDPIDYRLQTTSNPRSFNRVSVNRDFHYGPFLVRPDTTYTDVVVYATTSTVDHTAWGRPWRFSFKEVFLCPYYHENKGVRDPYLYYRQHPYYQVELSTDSWVEDQMALDVLESHLPPIYRSKKLDSFVKLE